MSRANPRFRRTNLPLPTLLAQQNCFRIAVLGTADNQIWICNFDYIVQTPAVPNVNAEQNLTINWITAHLTNFRGFICTDTVVTAVKATCLTIPARQPYTNIQTTGNAGTITPPHADIELAVVFSKYTGFKGQHGRGRNYLPAIPQSFINSTSGQTNTILLTTAYQTFIGTLLSATISDGTSTYVLAITQRTKQGVAVTNGAAVLAVQLRTLMGTVRRRRIGRGK